jgi:hypothetical protein
MSGITAALVKDVLAVWADTARGLFREALTRFQGRTK